MSCWRAFAAGLVLFTLLSSLSTSVSAQKLVTPGYLLNSDPTCREIKGEFYLFTTQDPFTTSFERPNPFYKGMYAYHALTTKDFDHWVDHGSILTSRDVAWNLGNALWDGDAGIPANGQYYAYAPFRITPLSDQDSGTYKIGVFTSRSPFGPYRDVFHAPMKMADGSPLVGLSPAVIPGDDGSNYLIWGSGDTAKHEVMLGKLKDDMLQLAEAPRAIAVPRKDSCGNLEYFESPVLFKAGKRWYLTYVAYKDNRGPGCEPKGAYINYTVADSMFGPFDGEVHHLIYPAGDGEESIQQGVCTYKGKMYLGYHVPYENFVGENDHHRQVALTALKVLPNGLLQPVVPGRDEGVGTPGVTHLLLDAFAPRREAVEFQVRNNADAQPGLRGEYQIKFGDGGYILFHNVDFGTGAKDFRVEVSSENTDLKNGVLEIHLDTFAGPVVGSIPVLPTGGATEYKILTTQLKPGVKGVHDLALVAHGQGSATQRRLFNVTWFAFSRP